METIKGGRVAPHSHQRRRVDSTPKYSRELEFNVPSRIEVKTALVNSVVPGHVFRQAPFKFDPQPFATESQRLNNKIIESDVQNNSLSMFIKDPTAPMLYFCGGNPDDAKAKYFAAYLVQVHIKHLGIKSHVVWHTIYGGYENKLVTEDYESKPTLIVLANLTPTSTAMKLEKARDILVKYSDIPIIVINAGMDPLSFATTRLYSEVHGMFYHSESIVKKQLEVI